MGMRVHAKRREPTAKGVNPQKVNKIIPGDNLNIRSCITFAAEDVAAIFI